MTIGALCYTLYTGSFILASAPIKYPEQADLWIFNKNLIKAVILVTAACCGFGASILWVAQGKYLARIANNENKGTFNSIFWAFFMSSQIIGALFAAIVLQNTDAFTFYCIMTFICLLASLFFLFLKPVDTEIVEDEYRGEGQEGSQPVIAVEEEASTSTKEDIKQTFIQLMNPRIATLYPAMISTALNLGIISSVFIKMMVDTMDDDVSWSKQTKDSNALFCMIALGVGEIFGSMAFGYITDNFTTNQTGLINIITCSIGYGFLILYGIVYDFSFYLGILMTFSWGVQDAGINCLLNSLLGFQFESKTTPFSVYKFLQSLLIFIVTCIESATSTQRSYVIYFVICYIIAISAWIVLLRFFTIKTTEQVEEMRAEANKKGSEHTPLRQDLNQSDQKSTIANMTA